MKHKIILLISTVLLSLSAFAQCPVRNTAFQSGEHLSYDLYFNWKFIWFKVGSADIDIKQTKYKGQDAYRAYLITRGSKTADRYFVLRDTLTTYTTLDIVPLYFVKNAIEGKRYTREKVIYSYGETGTSLDLTYQKNSEPVRHQTVTVDDILRPRNVVIRGR